ncbi:MAG: sulfurtransferase TusA family protein [Alphaproteobacteria bacterium]|nr:sulfurtransferase TusA family protein [Alphaproteobacteria bacterium]MBE8220483.1 sulfurtransferase TusA family protein [Alphaproteobacteria bacterium]
MPNKIDATGLQCPLPVLRLARGCRGLTSGTRIEIKATDPMTNIDIPHWLQEQGHRLITQKQSGDTYYFVLEIK